MKKIIYNLLKTFTILLLVFTTYTVAADNPPPPPSGSSSNNSGNQLGGNAPIGGGLFILIGLGAAYGGRKIYGIRKKSLLE